MVNWCQINLSLLYTSFVWYVYINIYTVVISIWSWIKNKRLGLSIIIFFFNLLSVDATVTWAPGKTLSNEKRQSTKHKWLTQTKRKQLDKHEARRKTNLHIRYSSLKVCRFFWFFLMGQIPIYTPREIFPDRRTTQACFCYSQHQFALLRLNSHRSTLIAHNNSSIRGKNTKHSLSFIFKSSHFTSALIRTTFDHNAVHLHHRVNMVSWCNTTWFRSEQLG